MSSSFMPAHGRINTTERYTHELQLADRWKLCAILDELDLWFDLAINYMQYSVSDLQGIKRAMASAKADFSPTNELLNLWDKNYQTVTVLFYFLCRMKQYAAMDVIKSYVDDEYHKYIKLNRPKRSDLEKKKNPGDILQCGTSSLVVSNGSTSLTVDLKIGNVDKLVDKLASSIPRIDYNELLQATNKWSDKYILGKGGFGTVFQGSWKETTVAIKRITYHGPDGGDTVQIQQSLNELKLLNSYRHDNILPLYGYSINGAEPCLVYQLMEGGSLEQLLQLGTCKPLAWDERLKISCGVARGIQYLHTVRAKPVIHGDIKPANILLDKSNKPKIGDFGLARESRNELNSSMEVSRVFGTRPYLPLEYLAYKSLSTKVDTYSFGVVLLEMFTGLRAYDKSRANPMLTRHIISVSALNDQLENLIDRNLLGNVHVQEICKRVINLGRVCVAENREHRPEMVKVLQYLESCSKN